MTIRTAHRPGRHALRRATVAAAILLSALGAGCSFERAFCGTGSLTCKADAEYNWAGSES